MSAIHEVVSALRGRRRVQSKQWRTYNGELQYQRLTALAASALQQAAVSRPCIREGVDRDAMGITPNISMTLRVIGAGLGRTGTSSLKAALERLLDAPCYHMMEVFKNPVHVPMWHAAASGEPPDWHDMLAAYRASVDWPAASFWPELCDAFPDALVLLSLRDPEDWWESVSATIFHPENYVDRQPEWYAMWRRLIAERFTSRLTDKEACISAFNRHNEAVRRAVAPERLLEWRTSDGWEPLCRTLGLPIPAEPFPHANTRSEFTRSLHRS